MTEKFSQRFPDEIHIIQLDNLPFHRAKQLKIPENIILIFQPPYCWGRGLATGAPNF